MVELLRPTVELIVQLHTSTCIVSHSKCVYYAEEVHSPTEWYFQCIQLLLVAQAAM